MDEQREYWPLIEGGTVARLFRFGDYRAALVTHTLSLGSVTYLYVMEIYRMPECKLCLCVASEENGEYGRMLEGDPPGGIGASHFLGLFPGQGHVNLGASNDWADVDRFTARALQVARDHLTVPDEAVEETRKKPWWRFW